MAYTTTAPVFATGKLTFYTVATDSDTVTIGAKTYTMEASLTDVDGHVFIGTTQAICIANLYAAINLSGTTTQYAATMTAHPSVYATAYGTDSLTVTAHAPGTIGNGIVTTDTLDGTSAWAATHLTSGAGNVDDFINSIVACSQINSDVLLDLKRLTQDAD
jgi:hypothetical protein